MYLTTIDDNRAIIQCNFVKGKFVKVSALYDTGARTSIITALSINLSLSESDFEKYEKTSIKLNDALVLVHHICIRFCALGKTGHNM